MEVKRQSLKDFLASIKALPQHTDANPRNVAYRVVKPLRMYKKVVTTQQRRKSLIAVLEVPAQAIVVIPEGYHNKIRVSSAKVLEIIDVRNKKRYDKAVSPFTKRLTYKVGKVVYPNMLDRTDIQCSNGINVFRTKRQAICFRLPRWMTSNHTNVFRTKKQGIWFRLPK